MNPTFPSSVLILGAGQAGAWAAKTLRSEGYDGEITLVGDEQHPPYERPPLSKAQLGAAETSPSALVLGNDMLDALSLDWRRGALAERLDLGSKYVHLRDGARLAYGKLILCTGGRALLPPIAGISLPGVFTLRSFDDCVRLGTALRAAQRVCIIGGGWIGLEVASTARQMGKSVTLLHKGDSLCERVLPQAASGFLFALHRSAGVDVRLNSTARAIEQYSSGLAVQTTSDEPVQADLVLVATGMAANDSIAADAGLACDRGVLVDSHCTTSDPDVLAAGDVAVAPNSWAQQQIRLESWQNAIDQSTVAAKVALGRNAAYDPLPWFWSDQFGVNLQIYGWPQSHHRVVSRNLGDPASQIFFLLDGSKVEAAIAINAPRELRMGRKLIENRVVVRDSELKDPTIRISSIQTAAP